MTPLDFLFLTSDVAEYAYITPSGSPICWPVTPFYYPDRAVLAVSTGLAYPNKAMYAKRSPKVAMRFVGKDFPQGVLVQGDAEVLDEDVQTNTDRYIRELRAKSPLARMGVNAYTAGQLDFYLPRLWIEISPSKITMQESADRVGTVPGNGFLRKFGKGTATLLGEDGYPRIFDATYCESRFSSLTGPGSLTFHRRTFRNLRLEAHLYRGEFKDGVFDATSIKSFFGNGFFPLSAMRHRRRLRRRLKDELQRRGMSMPELRT